ncbi:MAG: M20/M25/M40 family metallo-hydrolase [Bacteroidota bacterium]
MKIDSELLRNLCAVHGPSGDEGPVKEFILKHIRENKSSWVTVPTIYDGDDFQNCIILEFGSPKTAVFAHIDTIGFTSRYQNQLVPIGGPYIENGYKLVGRDSLGEIECTLQKDEENRLYHDFARPIDRGTTLTFKCDFTESKDEITSCYLDNRLGVYNALKVAETLTDGVLVFSTWEEHGGGSVPFLIKYIYEKWRIKKALISDITWVTDGVMPGRGAAISIRDRNIPRKVFIDRIIRLAEESGIDFQLEVEGSGSSDGREIQQSPYPIDWCFIGAPEDNVHSPNETVHKKDILSMIKLYVYLMNNL